MRYPDRRAIHRLKWMKKCTPITNSFLLYETARVRVLLIRITYTYPSIRRNTIVSIKQILEIETPIYENISSARTSFGGICMN